MKSLISSNQFIFKIYNLFLNFYLLFYSLSYKVILYDLNTFLNYAKKSIFNLKIYFKLCNLKYNFE